MGSISDESMRPATIVVVGHKGIVADLMLKIDALKVIAEGDL